MPISPERQNVFAGRLMLGRIDELASRKVDFGFETTLAGRSYVKRPTEMQANGYRTVLFFLWLPDSELAVARVANRVRQGGHNVPTDDIRRRYAAGLRNLFALYRPLVDDWWLYDASRFPPAQIAWEERGQMTVKHRGKLARIEQQAE